MSDYLQALGITLPAKTTAGKIRQQAFAQLPWDPTPTTMVSYVSSIRVLIIANETRGLEIQAQLPEKMQSYLALSATQSSVSPITNGWNVSQIRIEGYLGRFEAFIDSQLSNNSQDEQYNLGLLFNIANGLFDQVIDCSTESLINAAIKPPGYYYLGSDIEDTSEIISQLSELIGEFEKPRYFNYDPDICAHGSSGITGCTKCLDACPTQAIISIGDKVQVNPYLCQGGGSCTSICPSGAMTYTYPKAQEQIEFLRQLIENIRTKNVNQSVCLLIYDNEHGSQFVAEKIDELPEIIIPFAVEDIGSVGLDLLSCALAYGASPVYVYLPDNVTMQVSAVINQNISLLTHLIDELNLQQFKIRAITDLETIILKTSPGHTLDKVANFSAVGNKRDSIRSAWTHLYSIGQDEKKDCIALPEGSLFGQINVDDNACTLCMACVSVCPARALLDGEDSPALKFIEANCLQCGICTTACPENAIELEPRIHFDHNKIQTTRILKEEQPFRCLNCGKPFASKSMIQNMIEKLKGHSMFEDPAALKRLKMCGDCRVIDMFANK